MDKDKIQIFVFSALSGLLTAFPTLCAQNLCAVERLQLTTCHRSPLSPYLPFTRVSFAGITLCVHFQNVILLWLW